jgi:hypothetical protein
MWRIKTSAHDPGQRVRHDSRGGRPFGYVRRTPRQAVPHTGNRRRRDGTELLVNGLPRRLAAYELLGAIRQVAFDKTLTADDALRRIRDAFREYDETRDDGP